MKTIWGDIRKGNSTGNSWFPAIWFLVILGLVSGLILLAESFVPK